MYIFTHQEYLDDYTLQRLYNKLRAEGLYDKVFYEDNHPTANSFVDYIRNQCWMVHVMDTTGEDMGVFWLDGFSGKAAFFHYWVFKVGWGQSKDLQREVIEWLTEELKDSILTLVGKTPASNKLAIRFLKQGGFKILEAIPDAIGFANGTLDDAIISYRRLNQ